MRQATGQAQGFSEKSDQALAELARQDRAAFTQLYQRHVKRVYAYLASRVGNPQDAQDLTTQTFMAALEQIDRYRGAGTVAAWLQGIAHHKLIDLRRQSRAVAPLDLADDQPAETPLPDEVVLLQVQRAELEHTLQQLTPDRGAAIALRFFGELSMAEVAAVMGKPEAAVKMLVHRGLHDLRVRLLADKEKVL